MLQTGGCFLRVALSSKVRIHTYYKILSDIESGTLSMVLLLDEHDCD